jgi:5-hydroxyisourate hydrolase-like protein (transthyretin family)
MMRLQAAPLHKVLLDSTMSMATPFSSTILLAAEESWRQYVPLAVSLFVILDILLGSPMANSVLGLVRTKDDDATEEKVAKQATIKTKGERIDSSQVAEAALERARNALEWQTERDKYKTDAQRMEELRRKMDDQLRAMDSKE